MTEIVYRTATSDDLHAVSEVQVVSQTHLHSLMHPAETRPSPQARDWPAWLANRPPFARPGCAKRIELATATGQVVGFAACRHGSNFDGYGADLTGLYVLPRFHRRGIGEELLRRIARWLAADGIDALAADVVAANPFRRFYERLGAQVIAEWSDDEPCLTYGLKLAGLV